MTWWKRKSRFHRALWRNAAFWPAIILAALLVFYPFWTIVALAIASPYIIWRAWQALRFVLFVPFNANGEVIWKWHPRIKRLFRKKYRPGLHSNVAEEFDDIPPGVENAIQAQLEMEAQDDGHPFAVPVKRMRRLRK
jgi:hypothetical protein